jgi:hypothetical protein
MGRKERLDTHGVSYMGAGKVKEDLYAIVILCGGPKRI